jgi:hypothetical protein
VSQYQAGVCNIGGAEVAKRKQLSYVGGLIFILFLLTAVIQDFSLTQTSVAMAPAILFSVGFIQSRRKFCLAYGLMGTFNFAKIGTLTRIEDRDSLKADRGTAISILLQSLGLALLLTSIALALTSAL